MRYSMTERPPSYSGADQVMLKVIVSAVPINDVNSSFIKLRGADGDTGIATALFWVKKIASSSLLITNTLRVKK